MIFEGFKIHATEYIHEAYCECHNELKEVSNGLLSAALYCPKCENVYLIKKVKLPKNKVTKEFLEQCRFEVNFTEEKFKLRKRMSAEIKGK